MCPIERAYADPLRSPRRAIHLGAMSELPVSIPNDPHRRWRFLRDVVTFQLKLALNNVHNFVQMPLTAGAALIDLVFKGQAEGGRFYKLVEYGRTIDDSIDIYSIIEDRERSLNKDYTVDAVLSRIEAVIVREYEKGGTAASIKAAVDRAIDGMQAHGSPVGMKADEAIKRAAEKIREKMPSRSG